MRFAMLFRARRTWLSGAALTLIALVGSVVMPQGASPISPSEAAWFTASNCGAKIYKPTGVAWKCTLGDDFSSSTLDTRKWSPMLTSSTGVITPECRTASSNNVKIVNGSLMLTARREAAPFSCKTPTGSYTTEYTGGAVTTFNKFSQAYGRFEIRASFPAAKTSGLHSALWLWPQKLLYGGSSGEIDIAEFRTAWADRVFPYVHYTEAVPGTDMNYTNHNCYVDQPEDFHTYTLDWTRTTITISYDGVVCVSDTWTPAAPLAAPAPFDTPFAMILNQGIGINANSPDANTPLPGTMLVDYVRVWS